MVDNLSLKIENAENQSIIEIFNYWNAYFSNIKGMCHKTIDSKYSYKTETGVSSFTVKQLLLQALDKYGYDTIIKKIDNYRAKRGKTTYNLGKFLCSRWLSNELKEESNKVNVFDFKPQTLIYEKQYNNTGICGISFEELQDIRTVEYHFNYFYDTNNTVFSDLFDLEHIIVHYLYYKKNEPMAEIYIEKWQNLLPLYQKEIALWRKTGKIVKQERQFNKIISKEIVQIIKTWNKKGYCQEDIDNLSSVIIDKLNRLIKVNGVNMVIEYIDEYIPEDFYDNKLDKLKLIIVLNKRERVL